MQLEFLVEEQTIYALPTNSIPRRGSKEYLSLLFRFPEAWEKYTKTVYFQYGEYSEPVLIGDSGVVDVPAYFTAQESFLIMLVGIAGGEVCPTNVLCITLEASGETWEIVPPDTEMPAYQQLVALAQEAAASANAAKDAAENANKASVFVPHVSEDGTLSWSNDKGLSNPPEVNIKGPQGDKGQKGNTGAQGPKGDTGETSLPVARAGSEDGIAYTATDAGSGSVLPTVAVANSDEHIAAIGKGRQIVFIPYEENLSYAPTLQINGGEVIPIRLRAPKNQGTFHQSPDATLSVPVGALMCGVPYTLTFCGKYWLIDSLPYSGRVDKTTDYAAWTPAGGTVKTLENYAKTLQDGEYYLEDDDTSYFVDVFTASGYLQWRILRKFTDESFYIQAYCGQTLVLDIDSESGYVEMGGRNLLSNDNIPLPTTADVGKVLVASTQNRAVWTAVTNAEEVAV